MKITKVSQWLPRSGEALVIPVFRGLDRDPISKIFPETDFILRQRSSAKADNVDTCFFSTAKGCLLLLCHAGKANDWHEARKLAKRLVVSLHEHRVQRAAIYPLQQPELDETYWENFIDFLYMSEYRYEDFRRKKSAQLCSLHLVWKGQGSINQAKLQQREALLRQVAWVRDLVNGPAAQINPDRLVEQCQDSARSFGFTAKVLRRRQLAKEKAAGILAVGQGSTFEPALVQLIYEPEHYQKTIALVGKGVSFDSGGLNLKTSGQMADMKADMAGAAVVLGVFRAAAQQQIPVRLLGFLPIAENMVGRESFRPGDIITFANGKSVEVVNTDAEGRLLLADALLQACRNRPNLIIELSTLSGSMTTMLGEAMAGLICQNRRITSSLIESGQRTGEYLWELPFFVEYRESILSKVADLKNAGYSGAAALKAGIFLHEFTGHVPFAHIDIAGTAFLSKENYYYGQTGSTGFGLRLLIDFLERLAHARQN